MHPANVLRVLCVGTVPGARPATCDPAIDLVRTTAAALTRYERERTDEARADIALLPDAVPVLFDVAPLTSATWRWVQEATGETRSQRAFQAACHGYTDERSVEVRAKVERIGKVELASDEWLDAIFDRFGAGVVREVAQVAMDRAEAGPRALAPFGLPRGLMLPR